MCFTNSLSQGTSYPDLGAYGGPDAANWLDTVLKLCVQAFRQRRAVRHSLTGAHFRARHTKPNTLPVLALWKRMSGRTLPVAWCLPPTNPRPSRCRRAPPRTRCSSACKAWAALWGIRLGLRSRSRTRIGSVAEGCGLARHDRGLRKRLTALSWPARAFRWLENEPGFSKLRKGLGYPGSRAWRRPPPGEGRMQNAECRKAGQNHPKPSQSHRLGIDYGAAPIRRTQVTSDNEQQDVYE
jgi:hypothetical protein